METVIQHFNWYYSEVLYLGFIIISSRFYGLNPSNLNKNFCSTFWKVVILSPENQRIAIADLSQQRNPPLILSQLPHHHKGTVFAPPVPVLGFVLLTKEMMVNSILWNLIPSWLWLRNIRYLTQKYKSKPASKFGFRFVQCLLKLPFLLARFMKVTDSQQLCSCEGTLEAVKIKNTFGNIGCSIFFKFLCLGGGEGNRSFWSETVFKRKQTKKLCQAYGNSACQLILQILLKACWLNSGV